MNEYGRVAIVGAIATYNDKPGEPTLAPCVQGPMVFKQLKMEGFLVNRVRSKWNEGVKQMIQWMNEGKIVAEETVHDGFENVPKALQSLFTGTGTGKAVVRC